MVPRRSLTLQSPARVLHPTASRVRARPFHSSPSQHNVLVDISHQIFQDVHASTGLSWAVSIPYTAFLFRLAFAPVQAFGLALSKTRQSVQPLQVAQSSVIARHAATLAERGAFKVREEHAEFLRKESARRTSRIRKDYKFQSSRLPLVLGLGFLPIWIINAGVIQAMASVKGRGLLSYIFDPATLPLPEPAFETEGFLWISSLSDPDPTYILPGIFGLLIYLSTSRSVSTKAAQTRLAAVKTMYGPGSLPRIQATAQSMFAEFIAFAPFPMAFIMTQAPAALVLLVCGSAATQAVLSPLLRSLVGSQNRVVTKLIPQIPKLKHRYRDMHSMDDFRPPLGNDSQPAVSLGPQATHQESKSSQPGRVVAHVPGSPASSPTYHQRR